MHASPGDQPRPEGVSAAQGGTYHVPSHGGAASGSADVVAATTTNIPFRERERCNNATITVKLLSLRTDVSVSQLDLHQSLVSPYHQKNRTRFV